MFSRYIDKVDFKSRFRILKGGKVSLVVSAIFISSSMIGTNAYSADISLTNTDAVTVTENSSISTGNDITGTLPIDILGANYTSTIAINHNVAISEVESAIHVNELGEDSSVTIASGKTLSNSHVPGNSFALNLETDLTNATITNNGTISASASSNSDGIYVNGTATDSQILNSGTLSASSTRILEVNNPVDYDMKPNSIGIEVESLVTTAADNSKITNSGTLNSTSIATITANGEIYVYEGYPVIPNAKGILVGTLTGVEGGFSSVIENSGSINVTSKININFANEGDSLDVGLIDFKAVSAGVEVGSSSSGVIFNTATATITSLAKIDVDEKGAVIPPEDHDFGAISSGIKINESFISSGLMNLGTIDSQAIFNGTIASFAESDGILLDNGEMSNSTVISNNIISKALATSINPEDMGAISTANGIRVETDITGASNVIGSYGTMSVESKANSASFSSAEGNGIYINANSANLTVQNGQDWDSLNGVQDPNAKIIVNVEATTSAVGGSASVNASGISTNSLESSTIINNGTIEVTATANSYDYSMAVASGIDAGNTNYGYSITNNGTITVNANTSIIDSSGEVWNEANAWGIKANSVTLDNTGMIEAYINGKLDVNARAIEASGNTSVVTNSGMIKGNIWVDGSLSNSGTIELPYNATNATVGDFTNTSTGKLTIGVMSRTEVDEDGNLIIKHSTLETQNATFENGSTLGVNVLTLSGNQNLLKGQTLYNVVKADNALTIEGTLNVTDNSALLDFSYVQRENSIDLNIAQGQTVEEAVKNISPKVTQYTNAQGAAKAFDKIIDNIDNNPRMNSVITRLNQLSSNEAVAKAVESTTPVAANATVGATTQISNGIAGIVTQRQNANISGGMNSGDGMFSEKNMWIKPFGSIGSQNDKDGINGFDVKTYGLGFGADTEYKNNQKLGVAFFYTNANVDVNNMNQNADLDVFTTLVYGNVPIIDDKTNFLYQVGYSWQKTQTDREVFTGDKAESKYTSKTASLDLKLMRDVNVNKDLLLQPLVNTTYRHFTNPAYNETGADALNLNVDKFTSTDLIVGLGTLAHYKLDKESKILGNVNVGYDLHDKNQTVTSAYEGASGVSFETQGIDNGRWSYEAGIGYEKDISATSAINVAYDYQGQGTDFSNNIISAKYVLKF